MRPEFCGFGPTSQRHELRDRLFAPAQALVGQRAGRAAVRSVASVTTLTAATRGSGQLTCEQCGTEFVPRRRKKDNRFCRPACRAAWHGARKAALRAELAKALARANQIVHEL